MVSKREGEANVAERLRGALAAAFIASEREASAYAYDSAWRILDEGVGAFFGCDALTLARREDQHFYIDYLVVLDCGHRTYTSESPVDAQIEWCPICANYSGMIVQRRQKR